MGIVPLWYQVLPGMDAPRWRIPSVGQGRSLFALKIGTIRSKSRHHLLYTYVLFPWPKNR